MVNSEIIIGIQRRKNVAETSTFGAELVALKTTLKMTEALVYKLTMFGVKIEDTPIILSRTALFLLNKLFRVSVKEKASINCISFDL